jgi:hypothetical protein
MWRTTLLTVAVLLSVHAARAQPPSYMAPGGFNGPTSFPRSPGRPVFAGPPLTPPGGAPVLPGPAVTPVVAPSAPITTPPAGANPAFGGPAATTAAAAPLDNTIAFDPDKAELVWRDNRWQLVSDTAFLKDFGRYEAEGREVLRVVRDLRLNTLTAVGSPRPVMEYWLSNGQAPRGHVAGLHTVNLDPAALTAEQVQGQWCVHDGSRILFNFGQQGDACRRALAAIQRYNFNQIGYVGQVAPVMLVFLANPPAVPVTPIPTPAPNPNTSRFPRLFGGQEQPPAHPQQPNLMPAVSSQPLGGAQGTQAHQPGGVTQASLRLPGTEALDRVALDARQLQVRRDGSDWKLTMGNHVVANFGPNQADAQIAQAALRHYGCTEQVFVGNPRPVFSYFLSNGQAPHGVSYAVNAMSFRPESLQVKQFGTSAVLFDGSQVLMSFGDRAAEAQQALQAIQRYRFDRMATFGHGDQSMTLFVRTN